MKTDNELIAEFMGMSSFKTEHDTFWHPNEKCSPENWKYHSLDLDNFYPKSWDWLMPVVEKIESLPIIRDVTINITGCSIYFKGGVTSAHETTKLSSVYMSVITFIKWYNQQPK